MEISLVPHRTKVLELGKVIKGPYKMIGGGGGKHRSRGLQERVREGDVKLHITG